MERKPYVKPGITSSEAFTLTSQACDANQDPGLCNVYRYLLWDFALGCDVFYKGLQPGGPCMPPHNVTLLS